MLIKSCKNSSTDVQPVQVSTPMFIGMKINFVSGSMKIQFPEIFVDEKWFKIDKVPKDDL